MRSKKTDLEEVLEQFEAWRAKPHGRLIPEELWKGAVSLLDPESSLELGDTPALVDGSLDDFSDRNLLVRHSVSPVSADALFRRANGVPRRRRPSGSSISYPVLLNPHCFPKSQLLQNLL